MRNSPRPGPLSGCVVIFDLDGTLVETAPDLAAAMNHVIAGDEAAPLALSAVRNMVGRGARAMLEKGYRAAGLDMTSEEMDTRVAAFIAHYKPNIAARSFVFPGARACLDHLRAEGAALAVATNKPEGLAAALLDALALSDQFESLIGGDSLPVRKPDAAPLIEAARRAGGGDRLIMVGDSETDVKAARAAGAPVAVATFGYSERPIAELGADAIFSDYAELPAIVQRLAAAEDYSAAIA